MLWKVLRQSSIHGSNDMPDRPGVVIARYTHNDVSLFDFVDLLENFRAKNDFSRH
jgi:hypothetical protein